MKEELQELVREARRALRRASGIPSTADEQLEERRLAQIEEMDLFTFRTFGPRLIVATNMTTVYTDTNAAVEMTIDGHNFQLRKEGAAFVLFALNDGGDVELTRIDGADPNFANRVLVAMADASLK